MEDLLKEVGVIGSKYLDKSDENCFNIFEILRKKSDEVNLHSKFIYELLRDDGNHNCGKLFVKSFLDIIDMASFSLENYKVHREYKKIDLLLTNKTQAIIIENKIWAEDQEKQLKRYNDIIVKEGYKDIHIFYLTPLGMEPSEQSIDTLQMDDINLISYKYHINEWIDQCVDISSEQIAVREVVLQYKDVINKLVGKITSMKERLELIELLSKEDNLNNAFKIVSNWKHVCWHTEMNFWKAFETELKSKQIVILDRQKYSVDSLNSVLHKSRNRNPWYGLTFKIGDYMGSDIYLMIERGVGDLFYGIKTGSEDSRISLSKEIETYCNAVPNKFWAGKKYLEPRISFENFSSDNTFALCRDSERKELIDGFSNQVFEFVDLCQKIIKSK